MNNRKFDERETFGFLLIVASLCLPCLIHSSAAGTLYECTDGSGSRIFTDRPAQLQRCTPMPTTNQSSSAQGMQMAAPIPYQNALPAAIDPPPPPFTSQPDSSTMPPGSVAPQPCTPGFNPLNPLAAPPCQQMTPGQGDAVPRSN